MHQAILRADHLDIAARDIAALIAVRDFQTASQLPTSDQEKDTGSTPASCVFSITA